jgi:hypothetical protein
VRPPVGLEGPIARQEGGGRSWKSQSLVVGRSWQEFGVSHQEGSCTPSVHGPNAVLLRLSARMRRFTRAPVGVHPTYLPPIPCPWAAVEYDAWHHMPR